MANLYKNRDSNIRKTWLFMTGFLIFVILIGWIFSIIFQSFFILVFAVVFSILTSVFSYWYSDRVVLSMTHAKPIKKDDDPELYRIVENLSITAGLPMPRLYILEEQALNAFATGRNAEHAVVAVTRGLREKLSRTELEGVLAHELSHIENRDILLSTVVVVLAGTLVLLSEMFIRLSFFGGIGRRDSRSGGGHVIFIAVGIAAAILAPILATVIRMAISRRREYLADSSGALLTRYPEGLASALEKISNDQTQMKIAHNSTAHLFFTNPFKGGVGKNWFNNLFMTHPPTKERIAALRAGK